MNLKTKLLLASSAIVLVVLTLSEWIGYRQTGPFLSGHEMRMASEMNHGAVLADLQQGRQALLLRSATLHTFHGIITITALILASNAPWSRTVLRPLADLLRHINYMHRGSWGIPVPVRSKDEIGELTEAFNELGGQLTLTVHQFAAASKLSALALLGQSLEKRMRTTIPVDLLLRWLLRWRHANPSKHARISRVVEAFRASGLTRIGYSRR
jgi:HAMP domain-containing protein